MASYQDIDMRLRVVEDKLTFLMKSFQVAVQHPLNPTGEPLVKTFEEVYREVVTGTPLADAVRFAHQE